MNNPLMGGAPQASGPMANVQKLMNQLQQFSQMFNGNPQQQVQQMINSGRVTQEQLNWAHQQALDAQRQIQQFKQMMGGK